MSSKISYKNWEESFKWQYEAYPFFTSVYTLSAAKTDQKYHVCWHDFVNHFENGNLIGLLPKKEINLAGKLIISEATSGDDSYLKELKNLHQNVNDAIRSCEIARKNQLNVDLESWWPQSQFALSKVANILFSFDYYFDNFLRELQKTSIREFKALVSQISSTNPSFIDEANYYLRKLEIKHKDDFESIYEEFIESFGWFQNSYAGPFSIEKKWLKDYLEQHNVSKIKNNKKQSKSKLSKKYEILVKIAREGIVLRDDKKKLLLLSVELMDKWLKNICKENKLNYHELLWNTVDEIIINIKKNDFSLTKKYAKEGCRNGILNVRGYSDISASVWTEILEHQNSNKIKTVKGIVASNGKYIGRARIILNPRSKNYIFNDGDILVTSMTRPEFLPLMKKAAAFVTDEGGITCHAAIIAREMKKPCIIGTKIATKVLEDGDLVEVDANSGIVKILKKQ